jgi:uncharacterized protein (TIGR00645 family)
MVNSRSKMERGLERVLFSSRWLMAPFYLGMVLALALILVVFVRELVMELAHIPNVDAEEGLLLALSLIDLSLTGNLLLIVMFSGYENFVSKIHIAADEDRPSWMGTVDFAGIKLKLIGSIIAISGIALLRAFLTIEDAGTPLDNHRIGWMVAIHLTFVVSGVLLAVMDWITSRTEEHSSEHSSPRAAGVGQIG